MKNFKLFLKYIKFKKIISCFLELNRNSSSLKIILKINKNFSEKFEVILKICKVQTQTFKFFLKSNRYSSENPKLFLK